jgi:hypothetical protein
MVMRPNQLKEKDMLKEYNGSSAINSSKIKSLLI